MRPTLPSARPRFLSEADCQEIARRLSAFSRGGGFTVNTIFSNWSGNVRWARNQISTSGETRQDYVQVVRDVDGALGYTWILINETSDAGLAAVARRAERISSLEIQLGMHDLYARFTNEPGRDPQMFYDATYQLDAEQRARVAVQLSGAAADAGLLSAGYIEVSAHSLAIIDTLGHTRYVPYTTAQCSLTVRDPKSGGAGWAGIDWADWNRIDAPKLAGIAFQKCVASRHPVKIEPGRYTTILEPQAVGDLIQGVMQATNDTNNASPWHKLVGERVMDPRLTITSDPIDPLLEYPAFNPTQGSNVGLGDFWRYETYHPVTWVKQGVLQQFQHERKDRIKGVVQRTGLPNSGAFRMSGGETSLADMIASTSHGILVTRLSGLEKTEARSMTYRGYTRDGLWLVEGGKISKAVKNLEMTDSILFALNNVDQLGPPQRIFHPQSSSSVGSLPTPIVVPPMKIRDFNFTAGTDAV